MAAATFQIVSDLHLELRSSYKYTLKQTAPNLALLGDIGQIVDEGFFEFLESQLARYWNVYFLLGNHEPCQASWPAVKQRLRDFADKKERLRARSTIGRFIFLDQTRHDLNGDITVLGCTLFSRVSAEQSGTVSSRLIDFHQIQNWTVEKHIDAHISDVTWLNAQVSSISKSEPQRQIVIFTHHSPTLDSRAVSQVHVDSPVSSGFATNLSGEDCWKNESVALWAFGHTHFNCDFSDEFGKRIVANQRGYSHEPAHDFEGTKTFTIGNVIRGLVI